MDLREFINPLSEHQVRDYIDQCIMANNAESFNDLSQQDKENIVMAMLWDANDKPSARSDIILESEYDTVDGIEQMCLGKIKPKKFRRELIKGICNSYEDKINELFKERIQYFQNDPYKNEDREGEDPMDLFAVLTGLIRPQEIRNDNKNGGNKHAS